MVKAKFIDKLALMILLVLQFKENLPDASSNVGTNSTRAGHFITLNATGNVTAY